MPCRPGWRILIVDETPPIGARWPDIEAARNAMLGQEFEVAPRPQSQPELVGPCRVVGVEALKGGLIVGGALRLEVEVEETLMARMLFMTPVRDATTKKEAAG